MSNDGVRVGVLEKVVTGVSLLAAVVLGVILLCTYPAAQRQLTWERVTVEVAGCGPEFAQGAAPLGKRTNRGSDSDRGDSGSGDSNSGGNGSSGSSRRDRSPQCYGSWTLRDGTAVHGSVGKHRDRGERLVMRADAHRAIPDAPVRNVLPFVAGLLLVAGSAVVLVLRRHRLTASTG